MIAAAQGWIGARLDRRLGFAVFAALTLGSLIFLPLFTGLYGAQLQRQQERAAVEIAALLQAALENAMLKRDIPGLQGIVARLGARSDIDAVRILEPDGEVRFASDPALIGAHLPALAGAARFDGAAVRAETGALRAVKGVANRDACGGCHGPVAEHPMNGVLVVDYNPGAIAATGWGGALALAASGFVVSALALGALWWALRRAVLRPVGRLRDTADAVACGDLSARARLDGADELARLGGRFDSMTDRLSRALEAACAGERFLQQVIDAAPDAIRVIGPDYRILKVNRAYREQLGLAEDAPPLGRPCYASSHGRASACPATLQLCPVVELLEKRSAPMKMRDRHVRADGAAAHVEVSAVAATLGETRCVVESIRSLDAQARFSQEARLAGVGMLAAGVAHEIRNPLFAMRFALEELRPLAQAGPEAAALIETIEAELEAGVAITEGLLRLSESDAGPALLSLEETLRDVIRLLRYEIEQSGSHLDIRVADAPRLVISDSDLRTIILNLCQNALHAMPEGGRLLVEARAADGEVLLAVEDEGPGVAEADAERIFWPFWTARADGSKGAGLGLPITRAAVERHGGAIALARGAAGGARFELRFPDPDAPERSHAA